VRVSRTSFLDGELGSSVMGFIQESCYHYHAIIVVVMLVPIVMQSANALLCPSVRPSARAFVRPSLVYLHFGDGMIFATRRILRLRDIAMATWLSVCQVDGYLCVCHVDVLCPNA